MSEMSAFKNYTAGEPTCRLYIKNLAKHVDEKVVEGFNLFRSLSSPSLSFFFVLIVSFLSASLWAHNQKQTTSVVTHLTNFLIYFWPAFVYQTLPLHNIHNCRFYHFGSWEKASCEFAYNCFCHHGNLRRGTAWICARVQIIDEGNHAAFE